LNFLNVKPHVGNLEVSEDGTVCFRWAIDVKGTTASPKQFDSLLGVAASTFNNVGSTIGTVAFTKQSAEDVIRDFEQIQQQNGSSTPSNAPTSL
jgi:hypothetical protein